jgi:opacity protein-like surface antigen
MKHFLMVLILAFSSFSIAQAIDSVKAEEEIKTEVPQNNPTGESKWYYGGTVGFNFWSDYFYLSLNPLVGYQVSPKFSVGGKLMYAYINDQRYEPFELTSHNYGAGIFTRFRPIYQIYLHAEFDYASYEDYTLYTPIVGEPYTESERNWVPFLLLGGGFVQRVGPNAAVYVEVLFDVLQDENSPYEDWDPIISIGGGVGF